MNHLSRPSDPPMGPEVGILVGRFAQKAEP